MWLVREQLHRFASAVRRAWDAALHGADWEALVERARESESLYRQTFDNNTAVKLLLDPVAGVVVDANPAAAAFYGYSLEELRHLPIGTLNPMAPERLAAEIERARTERRHSFRFRHRRKDGELRDVDVETGVVRHRGKDLLFSVIQDVTAAVRAEDELRRAEARYHGLFSNVPIGIYRTDEAGTFLEANPAMARLLGHRSREELIGRSALDYYADPGDRRRWLEKLKHDGEVIGFELKGRRADGVEVWGRHSARRVTVDGQIAFEGALEDVTETHLLREKLEQANAELRESSLHDPLTGLANRRSLAEALGREASRALRHRHPLAAVMIDIDRFKDFNDSWGHRAGDAVLAELGRLLGRSVRPEDVACRYGGEEFLLLLPDTELSVAVRRAEEIREAVVRLPIPFDERELGPVSISLGVAVLDGAGAEALIAAADRALYEAKGRGRNRVHAAAPPPPLLASPA